MPAADRDSDALAVLTISLDAQIADVPGADATEPGAPGTGSTGSGSRQGGGVLGDPVERQRRYAERLGALHVVVKTGRSTPAGARQLAANAWAYPTRSLSRYTFIPDAVLIAARLCRAGLLPSGSRPDGMASRPSGIDVISAQDPFATGLAAYAVARRYGTPLNVQLHFDVLDNPFWLAERREHRPLNVLGKWLLRQASTVRVGTTREQEKLAGWGIARERIFLAPVPVDLERFRNARPDPRLRHGLAEGASVVLAAQRLVPQKDVPTLLHAAAEVTRARPDTRFVIAGDGPLRPSLERLAGELGLGGAVRFLGRVDRLEMPALYAAADVLAVSSVYEGTSLVAVEAAAAGKPVVTTDVAGAADTVLDRVSGHVVPVQNAPALAAALLDVLGDAARAKAMGAAGRDHAGTRFALDRAVSDVISMWRATAGWHESSAERATAGAECRR